MNKAIKTVAATFGVLLGLSGINHGLFEILQGNVPTPGLFIEAIGPAQRMWPHGAEPAFTLIPNFLITGITAIAIGLFAIFWSVWYLQSKHGATVFILLFVVLLLLGGGIAHVVFFVPVWAFATLINRPLAGWQKVLPENARRPLARWWPFSTALSAFLMIIALVIAVTGYVPGIADADTKITLCLAILGFVLVLLLFSYISAIAADILKQAEKKAL